jgi:CRISPR type III-A-associated protein Csm2
MYEKSDRQNRNAAGPAAGPQQNQGMQDLLGYIRGDKKDEYEIFSLEGLIKTKFAGKTESDTKMSQLRKFYDDVVTLDQDLSYSDSEIKTRLARIIPLARYSNARGNLDDTLMKLIDDAIKLISHETDPKKGREMLSRFRRIMEAIVAYKKEKRREGY